VTCDVAAELVTMAPYLRRLELDERDKVVPQVDGVEHEEEAGQGAGVAAAALRDGKRRDGALVGGGDVGAVCEGVDVRDGAEHLTPQRVTLA
jgi:hypothetical protein